MATTEIYTLSLHDALPIFAPPRWVQALLRHYRPSGGAIMPQRSEEHTSELQSRRDLVCRLLLEKKKQLASDIRVAHRYIQRLPDRVDCQFGQSTRPYSPKH